MLLFVLGLAATSAILTAYAPFPKLGNLWRKYHHLQEHGEKYSLLYIGSSRVFHEFIPEQFDAELSAKGHRIRSFNFGQDGMWPPESFYMLRQILASRPPGVKWILIDLMGIKTQIEEDDTTLRALYWHDVRHTWMALRHIATVDMEGQRTFTEKANRSWHHLRLWMEQSTGLGRGYEQAEVILKLARSKKITRVQDGGFEVGGAGPLRGEMLELFNRAVQKLKTDPPEPKPIQPVLRDALEDVIAEVRAAGAEPVFVVAAGIFGTERFSDWSPVGARVLRFDNPVRFPDLYDPAQRYDPHHLDERGARAFTRRLAEAFAPLLEEKR